MSIDLDWYAVVTEAQREEVAQRGLRRRGLVTYIPEGRGEARRRGKLRELRRRLFPGYVFIGLPPGVAPGWAVDGCTAVIGVVGFGTPPVPARIEATAIGDIRLRQFFGELDAERSPDARLRRGASAKLRLGDPEAACIGHVGRIVHVASDERIMVLFGSRRSALATLQVTRSLDEIELV